nr:immunoglobulin light chain junction region [Macaca mulatta]
DYYCQVYDSGAVFF